MPMPRPLSNTAEAQRIATQVAAAGFRTVLAWQIVLILLRLVLAAALAVLVGGLVENAVLAPRTLAVLGGLLVVSTLSGRAAERAAADAEATVAIALRARLAAGLRQLPIEQARAWAAGALVLALERRPAQLARLAVGYRAGALMLGLGPSVTAGAIATVSWPAACVLVLASPVMIVFFVLAGGLIRARASQQEAALGRLAAQFTDRIRTLPTILACHALPREAEKLALRMRCHSDATMRVLSVAFLNAGIIDFFSALSIAVLAVLLGLGHLHLVTLAGFNGLPLAGSLFVLMAAAEFFAPFRRFAEQYHAKAEGLAAAEALEGLLAPDPGRTGPVAPAALPPVVATRVEEALGTAFPSVGLVAVVGPSGAGKTTLLRTLAAKGAAAPAASLNAPLPASWVSADAFAPSGTLAAAIAWNRPDADVQAVERAAAAAGLIDDPNLSQGLETPLADDAANLSGGQRMRLSVARALLGDGPLLADEPTAKLDAASAARVRSALLAAARRRLVVVATHDPALAHSAVAIIDLGQAQCRNEAEAA